LSFPPEFFDEKPQDTENLSRKAARKSRSRGTWLVIPALVALIFAGLWVWFNVDSIRDNVKVWGYQPTAQVEEIAQSTAMTEHGKFMFYVGAPKILESGDFNEFCNTHHGDFYTLGCYTSSSSIFIYQITDQRLKGVVEVTAAHEMLHAAWSRLSVEEKSRLTDLLQAAYGKIDDPKLAETMSLYEQISPTELPNELHSILGTQYLGLGTELEEYYSQYFTDRSKVVNLYSNYQGYIDSVRDQLTELQDKLTELSDYLDNERAEIDAAIVQWNSDVDAYNAKINTPGGFSSQKEANTARKALETRKTKLEERQVSYKAKVAEYDDLITEWDKVAAESDEIFQLLDSNYEPSRDK